MVRLSPTINEIVNTGKRINNLEKNLLCPERSTAEDIPEVLNNPRINVFRQARIKIYSGIIEREI